MKMIWKMAAALFAAGTLYAGTAGSGGDMHGRLFNTAYYDVTIKGENTMMEYIKYSKRGGFDIEHYNAILTGFTKNAEINIYARVLVPEHITTDRVYVSVGSPKYSFEERCCANSDGAMNVYWNDSKQGAEFMEVEPKRDSFGNRYVDVNLKGFIRAGIHGTSGRYSGAASPFFNALRFYVAPMTRGFKNKFEKADIYVLDE